MSFGGFFNIQLKGITTSGDNSKGVQSVNYNSNNKTLAILLNDASVVTADLKTLQDFELVDTFANLPDATLNATQVRVVTTTTGIIGLTRKQAGMYYSDGATWTRLDVNYQADKTYYNNADSMFTSTNVKGALDEASSEIEADRINKHGLVGTHVEDLITINGNQHSFDIAPFDYYINGVKYSYAGAVGIEAGFVVGDDFQIVGIGANGLDTLPKDTFYTPSSLQNILELGGFATADGTNIITVGNEHFNYDEFVRNLYVWSKFAKKTNFIGTCCSVSQSTTPLQLNISSGDLITPSLNKQTISAINDIGMVAYYQVAGEWQLQATVTPFVIDTNVYNDGTNLVVMANNKFASHTVARSTRTGTFYFIYSEAQYNSLGEALDSPTSVGGFGNSIGNEVEPLAKIIVQKGDTSILDGRLLDVRNRTTSVISASTSTMQTTYDRSSIPQLTLSTGKAIEYRNNIDDTENIMQHWKSNNGLTTYASITKNGLIANGLVLPSSTKTSDYTVLGSDYTIRVDSTSNNVNITLPSPTETGRIYYVKRIDNSPNKCNIIGTVDGSTNIEIVKQYESLTLQANGSSWDII